MKLRCGVQRLTQSPHFDRLNISIDLIAVGKKKTADLGLAVCRLIQEVQPDGLLINGTNCSAIRGRSASSQ